MSKLMVDALLLLIDVERGFEMVQESVVPAGAIELRFLLGLVVV